MMVTPIIRDVVIVTKNRMPFEGPTFFYRRTNTKEETLTFVLENFFNQAYKDQSTFVDSGPSTRTKN